MSLLQTSLPQNFPTSLLQTCPASLLQALLQTFPTAPLLAPPSGLPVSLLPTPRKLSPCPCCQPQCQPCPCCCQRCWETPPSSHFLAEWLLHGMAGDKDPLQQTENMTCVLPSPTLNMEHPHPSREISKSWLSALSVGAFWVSDPVPNTLPALPVPQPLYKAGSRARMAAGTRAPSCPVAALSTGQRCPSSARSLPGWPWREMLHLPPFPPGTGIGVHPGDMGKACPPRAESRMHEMDALI